MNKIDHYCWKQVSSEYNEFAHSVLTTLSIIVPLNM